MNYLLSTRMLLQAIRNFLFLVLSVGWAIGCNDAGSKQAGPLTMADIISELREKMRDPQNTYNSEAKLAHCDSELTRTTDPMQRVIVSFEKAGYLLECGKETQAVALYEELIKAAGNDPVVRKNVLPALGMAYLRLAERTNCVVRHNSDACIMPIRGNGIHQDKYGARKAIETFEMVLRDTPDDLDARWLLNIAYMTIGEYPAKVPSIWLIPGLDTPGEYQVNALVDLAVDLGIIVTDRGGGAIVEDFNNDGYLDIVSSAWSLDEPMHYFQNNADGTFTDKSQASGLTAIFGGLNISHADYNNDGFADILVLRGGWQGLAGFGEQPNSLLRNNGDGTFTDVTIEAGFLSFHPTQTATWNDFNNDGWIDLFIGNETTDLQNTQPCELFINNGDGTFYDQFKQTNFNIAGFVKGVASGDFDNDGWPDVFISTMDGPKVLLRNMGIPGKTVAFENATQTAGFANEISRTFPTWFFDFDNDGWLDICVWNYEFDRMLSHYAAKDALKPSSDRTGKGYLYRNNRNGTFTNITDKVDLNQTAFAMGANFGDIDNDGFLDMYLGTGNPNFQSLLPNVFFKNIGGKKFANLTTSARVGSLQKGHGICFADLDNDGDQDIFADMGGAFPGDAYPSALYVNPETSANNWICLKLEGSVSNRAAIGAKITVRFREKGVVRQVYREVNSGGSFGCSPFRQEIGLGKASVIDEMIINWPASKTTQVFKNVKANQFLKIKETQTNFETLDLKTLVFKRSDGSIPMCAPVQ